VPPLTAKVAEGYTSPVLLEPAGNDAEVVVTANCVPPLPTVVQPVIKARAMRAKIPRILQATPKHGREGMDMATILDLANLDLVAKGRREGAQDHGCIFEI